MMSQSEADVLGTPLSFDQLLKDLALQRNIRELQNVIERAVIRSSGPSLQVSLEELQDAVLPDSSKFQLKTLEEVERENILAALRETKWVIAGPNGAAARLGMNRCTVEFRMKKLGIVKPWKLQPKDSITG